MSDESVDRQPPGDARELRERVDADWRQLVAAIDEAPVDRLTEPGVAGDWSLKDLFGHIAFWDEQALADLERALAGHERADNEWQAMNDADYAARRDRTVAEQRAAMERAHEALRARLRTLADRDASRVDAAVRPGTYEHYADHARDIARWRQATS